jgi:hypothetical protein
VSDNGNPWVLLRNFGYYCVFVFFITNFIYEKLIWIP